MKYEMFVKQLIPISDTARIILAQYLGTMDLNQQWTRLSYDDEISKLATENGWPENEVFLELAKTIKEGFGVRPSIFTREHLHLMKSDISVRMYLASLLTGDGSEIPQDKVFEYLFNPKFMLDTLKKATGTRPGTPVSTAELMLDVVLSTPSNADAIEAMYFMNKDWGFIIQKEKWMLDSAISTLSEKLECENSAMEVLKALVPFLNERLLLRESLLNYVPDQGDTQGLSHGFRNHDSQNFDILALTFLRQRILWIISHLREQASKNALEAAQHAPANRAIARLHPWLELYERGAIASALEDLLVSKMPVSTWLPRYELSHPTGELEADKPLVIKEISKFSRRVIWHGFFPKFIKVITFDILCHLRNYTDPQAVLRCRSVPIEDYNHLRREITQLTAASLSPIGESIGERILNTPVPIPNRVLNLIRAGIKQLGPAFVQCLVLCGVPLPTQIDVPWRKELNDRLPYTIPFSQDDVEFTCDVQGIVTTLREEYRKKGTSLNIVG
jgi:hypothetical protein